MIMALIMLLIVIIHYNNFWKFSILIGMNKMQSNIDRVLITFLCILFTIIDMALILQIGSPNWLLFMLTLHLAIKYIKNKKGVKNVTSNN